MVSPEPPQATSRSLETTSSPRISFSADFLDDDNFICISPHDQRHDKKEKEKEKEKEKARNPEFEFLSSELPSPTTMLSADELFFEGKLLPFWQKQYSEKLDKISLKTEKVDENVKGDEAIMMSKEDNNNNSNRMSWFIDEDPSPRPPKCTVLWKELLRLKKQRASTLSPSSSTSSSTSSSSSDLGPVAEGKEGPTNKEKQAKRIKKGLERTRSASIRIRPVINVPICTQGGRTSSLPPLFSIRKGRLER